MCSAKINEKGLTSIFRTLPVSVRVAAPKAIRSLNSKLEKKCITTNSKNMSKQLKMSKTITKITNEAKT